MQQDDSDRRMKTLKFVWVFLKPIEQAVIEHWRVGKWEMQLNRGQLEIV